MWDLFCLFFFFLRGAWRECFFPSDESIFTVGERTERVCNKSTEFTNIKYTTAFALKSLTVCSKKKRCYWFKTCVVEILEMHTSSCSRCDHQSRPEIKSVTMQGRASFYIYNRWFQSSTLTHVEHAGLRRWKAPEVKCGSARPNKESARRHLLKICTDIEPLISQCN